MDNLSDAKSKVRITTLKHLPGGHNQRRHGWRYGGDSTRNARNAMRDQPKTERDEYRKRAGMQEPKKVERAPSVTPKPSKSDDGSTVEKRMAFDEKAERAKIFKPNGLLQEGKTREDARGFQKILEVVRDAKGTNWTGAGTTIRDFANSVIGRGFKPKRIEGEISLVNASGQVIKIPKNIRPQALSYINFLHGKGEFSTNKELLDDYEDMSYDQIYNIRKHKELISSVVLKHLPGKHNQKLHGNRGGVSARVSEDSVDYSGGSGKKNYVDEFGIPKTIQEYKKQLAYEHFHSGLNGLQRVALGRKIPKEEVPMKPAKNIVARMNAAERNQNRAIVKFIEEKMLKFTEKKRVDGTYYLEATPTNAVKFRKAPDGLLEVDE